MFEIVGALFVTELTVSTNVPLVWARLPLAPVTVSVYVSVGVIPLVVTVSVDDDPVAGLGVKVPVSPVGRPFTLSVTPPVKPPVRAIVTL